MKALGQKKSPEADASRAFELACAWPMRITSSRNRRAARGREIPRTTTRAGRPREHLCSYVTAPRSRSSPGAVAHAKRRLPDSEGVHCRGAIAETAHRPCRGRIGDRRSRSRRPDGPPPAGSAHASVDTSSSTTGSRASSITTSSCAFLGSSCSSSRPTAMGA